LAYIKGVLDGDGYIDYGSKNLRLCLDTKSKEFVDKFINILKTLGLSPRLTERRRTRHNFNGYTFPSHHFIARATCNDRFLYKLQNGKCFSRNEKIKYIEGLTDSEGYYRYFPKNYFHSFIIGNKNLSILQKILRFLNDLGIKSTIYNYKSQGIPSLHIHNKTNIEKLKKEIHSFKLRENEVI